jgi:amidophosphoribosyltransferase
MCGFAGLVAAGDVARDLHVALQALQHRGQDSAGIATSSGDGAHFFIRRGLGHVTQALGAAELAQLPGPLGIAHVRYPTIGGGQLEDAQPFFYRQPGVLMAHNGQITSYDELRASLSERSIHLLSACDVEPVLCELADALMARRRRDHTIDDAIAALREVHERVRGAYSLVIALHLDRQPTLVVVRDPNGIRPAVVSRRSDGAWLAASESVACDVLGFERDFEPAPGEVVFLRAGQAPVRRSLTPRPAAPCVFEHIYFARPDSVIDGRSVYELRMGFGRGLAARLRAKGVSADVVVPVPDTARPAAAALAEELGIPLREGFIKNRYSGRTFIMPDPGSRNAALRLKLNPLPGEIRGRRVLLVDDSIVRGTTLRRVIALLRDTQAEAVHLAIHSPPVRHPCYYGIDMSTEEQLLARQLGDTQDQIERRGAAELGASSLTYLPLEAMDQVFGGSRCAACFDGVYPLTVSERERAALAGDRRRAGTA